MGFNLGSIFSPKANTQGIDNAGRYASTAYANTNSYLQPVKQYANSLLGYTGKANSALDDYANFLNRGVTDQQRAAYSNQLLGNSQRAFDTGQQNLLAQVRAQGGSSPLDSSVTAGMLTNLYGQQASALGQAGMQADQWARDQQQQNLSQRYGLLSGAANQGVGLNMQAGQAGSEAASNYSNQLMQLYQAKQQAQQLARQNMISNISGLASLAAPFLGGGGAVAAAGASKSSPISGVGSSPWNLTGAGGGYGSITDNFLQQQPSTLGIGAGGRLGGLNTRF